MSLAVGEMWVKWPPRVKWPPIIFSQGRLNQKATLIRPFQFSIFPYKLCFCDISGGRTFLRSIYRFRTQSIETFSSFYFEVKCLKRQVKHECYKISKIRAYFGYIHYFVVDFEGNFVKLLCQNP
jgi:hypothetical protein